MSPDVLIIGAGVIGLSIAHALTRQGLRVTLLDAGEPGKGASWASAGVLAPQGAHPQPGPYLDLSLRSLDLYPGWAEQLKEETGVDVEYRADGGLHVALDDGEYAELERRYDAQHALGLPVERLTPEETLKLEPALSPEIRGGLFFARMHQVENRRLVRALAVVLARRGAACVAGAPVTKLTVKKNRVTGVETPRGRFHAGMVINAAGCWARTIGDDPAAAPPVKPVRGQMLALEVGTTAPFRHVIHGPGGYLVPRGDGRLLVGATVEKAGFDTRVTAAGIAGLLNHALRLAPSLDAAPIVETWAGLRPMSKDGKPILGPAAVDGLILATGHYRTGILLAPVTAQLIAEYIHAGTVSDALKPFLPKRFDATHGKEERS